MLIGEMLVSNAQHFPDKSAIVGEDGSRLTWKDLDQRTNSLANALLDLGLSKGDRVAIISENCPEYMEVNFAAAKAGLIYVGLNYRLVARQLKVILADCEPKCIFVQRKFHEFIDALSPDIPAPKVVIGMDEGHGFAFDFKSLVSTYPSSKPNVELDEDDLSALTYTTGTTGMPKGVMRTHKNRVVRALQEHLLWRFCPDDVLLQGLPLYSAGGDWRSMGPSFIGACLVLHVFSGKSFCRLVVRERVTCTTLAPTRYKTIRDYLETTDKQYDFSSLRKVAIGGGQRSTPEQVKEMLDFCGVTYSFSPYGMTEAGFTALYPEDILRGLRPDATEKERRRLGSVGKPMLNVGLRLVDDDDNDLSPNQIGEIVLKGDSVAEGYWNSPEATKKAFRSGWYYTNDLGYLDEDGYLYFVGRKDALIKSGGFFVAPIEVESIIMQHPSVAEVAVFGVPDERWGEKVTAAVSLKKGNRATEEEIKGICKKNLAHYQVPKEVIFVDELPKERQLGKVPIEDLKRMYGGS